MTDDGNFAWYFGIGEHPDVYYQGGDNREQTVAQAWRDYPEGGFSILEGDKAVPSFDCFRADRVLEDYEEHNEECWGEDGAEIEASRGQQRELEQILAEALKGWMDRHALRGKLWSFGHTRSEEYFPHKEHEEGCSSGDFGPCNCSRSPISQALQPNEDNADPRGIPSDISETTAMLLEDWGDDAHSASWLPLAEAAEIFLRTEHNEVSDFAQKYPQSHFFGIDEESERGKHRIVFWFDN